MKSAVGEKCSGEVSDGSPDLPSTYTNYPEPLGARSRLHNTFPDFKPSDREKSVQNRSTPKATLLVFSRTHAKTLLPHDHWGLLTDGEEHLPLGCGQRTGSIRLLMFSISTAACALPSTP